MITFNWSLLNYISKKRQMSKIATLKPRIEMIKTSVGSPVAIERLSGWKLTKIRERILLRDNYTCQKCGRVSLHLEVDHIVPLAAGGSYSELNLQSLCRGCHALKSAEEEKGRGGLNL